MVYDILEVFKKLYDEKGDKLILDSYSLKDGLYVKIDKRGNLDYFKVKNKIFTDLQDRQNSGKYEWFKERDYYSEILNNDTNKCVTDKKIHNINYLTFFIKIDSLINNDEKKLLNNESIEPFFNTFVSFSKFEKDAGKEILNKYINVFTEERKNLIFNNFNSIKSNLEDVKKIVNEYKIKNYIKIFFDNDLNIYKSESEIYYSLKIFNSISFCEQIENLTYGLSDFNLGMGGGLSSSKKPFFQHKSRKHILPFMLLKEDAILLKKFADWLKNQDYKNKIPINKNLFINRGYENKEFVITDFDYIPLKSDDVKKHFKSIYVQNYLKIQKNKELISDYEIDKLNQLEQKVDELFYNKQLIFNYYKDGKDIKVSSFLSKKLQSILLMTKFSMLNYFRKYDKNSFLSTIKKHGTSLVLDSFIQGRELKGKEALNLKFSILKNKGEKIVNIELILKNVEKRLEEVSNNNSLTREEFLFLSGQWAYYLLSQSKSADRTFSLAEHYFRVKTLDKLKSALSNDLKKYKHAVSRDNKKIKKTIQLITQFDIDKKRLSDYEQDVFLVGFTVENIFYKKNEDKGSK